MFGQPGAEENKAGGGLMYTQLKKFISVIVSVLAITFKLL